MTKVVKNLVVKNGKQYVKVGVMLEGNNGDNFLLLDRTFNPAGVMGNPSHSSVLISLYDPEPKQHAPTATATRDSLGDFDDDIPF